MKRTIENVHISPDKDRQIISSNKKGRVTRSRPMKCNECGDVITLNIDECLTCIKCEAAYHMKCAGVTSRILMQQFKEKNSPWMCPLCNYACLNHVESVQNQLNSMNSVFEHF